MFKASVRSIKKRGADRRLAVKKKLQEQTATAGAGTYPEVNMDLQSTPEPTH